MFSQELYFLLYVFMINLKTVQCIQRIFLIIKMKLVIMPTKLIKYIVFKKIYVTRQRNVTVTVMFLERPRPIQLNEREGEIERILTIYEIIQIFAL